jgi:hypothetical protein
MSIVSKKYAAGLKILWFPAAPVSNWAVKSPAALCQQSSCHPHQEQIQIITSAIGRPKPNVPTIVSVNSKSVFDARGVLRTVMTLFP